MQPLTARLQEHVFAADRLHADDTPVPVLEPGKGKTKTGRLWTYVRDGRPWGDNASPAVCYFYSPDRKGQHPMEHLANFSVPMAMQASAIFTRAVRAQQAASRMAGG